MVSEASKQRETKTSFNIQEVKEKLKSKSKEVAEYLGLDLHKKGSLLIGCCPIHKGDNQTAFHIQTSGPYMGKMHCYTGDCNRDGTDLLSLIMRIKDIPFSKAIHEAIKIIGDDFLLPSRPSSFIKPSSLDDGIDPVMLKGTASRKSVRNILSIPSLYFVDRRHFDPKILDEYDVGDCWKVGNKMRGRTVFPVYDENMLCVGAVGRKISETWNTMKWKNSQDFKASETFYGIWNYTRTGRAIVVEGQGDLIKLRQAGYGDSLGMFKKCMSVNQLKILQKFGVEDLLVVTDNDKAGNQGYESIMRNASNHFKITRYIPEGKDFGEMNVESLRKLCL